MDVSALGSGSSCSEDCVVGSGCLEDCGNQSDRTDWEWEDFSGAELVCVTAVCVLLLAMGITGNMLTILVVWLRPHLRSTTYLYLSSMAVSDLLILLLMPLDLYYKLWRFRPWDLARYRHAVRSLLRSHTPRSRHPPLTPQHSTTTL
eukprot:XP_014057540.1 PREDICTED: growth hormone secretagogue receptor type 1-like [Salmo salar]